MRFTRISRSFLSLLFLCLFICVSSPARAADPMLHWYSSQAGQAAGQQWAENLKRQGVPVRAGALDSVDTGQQCLVFFGSPADPAFAALLEKALGPEEKERYFTGTFQGLLVKRDVWSKDQLVLFFIGQTNSGIRNAIDNSRESWSSILGTRFNVQISQDAFYGY